MNEGKLRTIQEKFMPSERDEIVRIKNKSGKNWHDSIISAFQALDNQIECEKLDLN